MQSSTPPAILGKTIGTGRESGVELLACKTATQVGRLCPPTNQLLVLCAVGRWDFGGQCVSCANVSHNLEGTSQPNSWPIAEVCEMCEWTTAERDELEW